MCSITFVLPELLGPQISIQKTSAGMQGWPARSYSQKNDGRHCGIYTEVTSAGRGEIGGGSTDTRNLPTI